jgi:MFS family permease
MSVFYSFFSYLGRIGIPEEWRGFLVGLEPMSAFALRLAIIPMVHVANATKVMTLAFLMTVAALWSYTWVVTIPSLIVLRIFHGAAFVLLVSASTSLAVHLIPKEKSAQGFGIMSITVLTPYAVVPLLTETLLPHVRNETSIYAGVTVFALPGFLLLNILKKRVSVLLRDAHASLMRRPTMEELRGNLRHSGVVLILGVNLLLYLCYSTVFYFVKGYFKAVGVGDPGHFFTIASLVMIAVRVAGGSLLNKADKLKTMILFAFFLIPWFIIFGHVRSTHGFTLLAAAYGLCIGVVLPLLNAAMFQISPQQFRGLNNNLSLFMMDAGFFVSPYAGGMLLSQGLSFQTLFSICSGLLLLAVCLLLILQRHGMQEPADALKSFEPQPQPVMDANGSKYKPMDGD